MAVCITSANIIGVDATQIEVEAQLVGSKRRFVIVGLTDSVVREAKERVRCAVQASGISFPHRELIVSLAPASMPKSGASFDLAIALAILTVGGHVSADALRDVLIVGELALDGRVKPVSGIISIADHARKIGISRLLVAKENVAQARAVMPEGVCGVSTLSEAIAFLSGDALSCSWEQQSIGHEDTSRFSPAVTFADVYGQEGVKRALEIAVAGGHNVLMVGPPGAGKSMLARRVVSIMPDLTTEEALEVGKIWSVAGVAGSEKGATENSLPKNRPFRAPHHGISNVGLLGGGSFPQPGEISLAHKGVLFLDEIAEMRRDIVDMLRQPLEEREVSIARASYRVRFPADFMLVAAMNPCPCGMYGSDGLCTCEPLKIERYRARVSKPILDRIDIQVWVPPVSIHQLGREPTTDTTPLMRERINSARKIQSVRYGGTSLLNAHLGVDKLRQVTGASETVINFTQHAVERLRLSARSFCRILKVARTIADLEMNESVLESHVAEALSYRF